jgi:hypothetical protein
VSESTYAFAGLRARLEVSETPAPDDATGDEAPVLEAISPELVAIDPDLARRARELLPAPPDCLVRVRPTAADAPAARRRAPLHQRVRRPAVTVLVAAGFIGTLVGLRAAFPPLRPHLEPANAAQPRSGVVHVRSQQDVRPAPPYVVQPSIDRGFQPGQGNRP